MSDEKKAPSVAPVAPPPSSTCSTTKKPARAEHPAALLYIEWWDHHSQDEWCADEDVDDTPLLVKTVGWLHSENDKVIVVYGNYSGENNSKPYSNLMTILKGSMSRRVTLNKASGRKGKKQEDGQSNARPSIARCTR